MARKSTGFDFDAWKDLAERDPAEFERQRRLYLHAEIDSAPADLQPSLRGLQWQIDMMRRRYRHPLAASAKLFDMMWQQVYGENGFLDALTCPPPAARTRRAAEVLPFRQSR